MTHSAPAVYATLRKRAEFKRVATAGLRRNTTAFTLQAALANGPADRFGLTVTRKVGTATERNRIKRRLRAAVAATAAVRTPSLDTVLIARRVCLDHTFAALCADIERQLGAARQKLAKSDR